MYLNHINECIDEQHLDSIPMLYDQEQYDEWISTLAKHELNVIIDDQVNPELELRETVDDAFTWVEHSGTLQSFDYADNYYAIRARGHTDADYVNGTAEEWKSDPYAQMKMIASTIVSHDVSSVLQNLISDYEHEDGHVQEKFA